ncbi:RNA-guided endonuclease InsQ/TnpB family protein [Pseudoduganella namucuonensis]|uniref:Putative transposase n=1 Tax=Pseudoduganella namucuonensis TaxID=1035707 RepID=A0A1I7M852_9BURK|nr:RNA-guided endonuclease TnpB family protein [Pseudoduganella namucuonensis]SFV17950.1 putative transposase [Pseudoduganella namucuonensis]
MERLQAFKFALNPNGEQQRAMRRFAGACRFVFNQALEVQIQRHEGGERKLGYAELCRLLTAWRNGAATPWLKEAPTHPLQQALKDLERAYTNFFAKRAAFPRFKKKGRHDSFRYPDPKQIKLDQAHGRVFLPKLGWLRYRDSRTVPGEVRNVTVSQSAGRWYVAIQTARDVERPVPSGGAVGIDMGIVRFATLSDGQALEPLDSFKRHEERLRRAQQAMSRKRKHGKNWNKAKARVQRIHARIGNARRDYLHKATTTICNNHAMVSVEDLKVRNMSASAAGDRAEPGRNVRAKSGLNKAILDQGWHEFRRQLAYKLAWRGGILVAVSPRDTSRTCPGCGHVSADNRPTQAVFACVACGYSKHADLVGAINILRAGHARCAYEVSDAARSPAVGTRRSGSNRLDR